jgi:hypothetical protein
MTQPLPPLAPRARSTRAEYPKKPHSEAFHLRWLLRFSPTAATITPLPGPTLFPVDRQLEHVRPALDGSSAHLV